jgi:hypothetical protein
MRPIVFLLVAAATGLVTYIIVLTGVSNLWFSRPSLTVEIIIVNVLITSGIYGWLSRTHAPPLFVNSYLLSIVMKLIFYSFLLLMLRLTSPQTLYANAVLVLACYFIFTILEVAVLFLKVGR